MTRDPHAVLQALVAALAAAPVAAAWLYGSVARGTARPNSDVDVAVLPARDATANRHGLGTEIARRAARALNTPRVTVVDLERVPLLLRHRVLREGRLLVDRDPLCRARFAEATLVRVIERRSLRRELDAGTLRRLVAPLRNP